MKTMTTMRKISASSGTSSSRKLELRLMELISFATIRLVQSQVVSYPKMTMTILSFSEKQKARELTFLKSVKTGLDSQSVCA